MTQVLAENPGSCALGSLRLCLRLTREDLGPLPEVLPGPSAVCFLCRGQAGETGGNRAEVHGVGGRWLRWGVRWGADSRAWRWSLPGSCGWDWGWGWEGGGEVPPAWS